MTNPTLTNLTTGEQLSITYNLTTTSDTLVVDTYNRTAIIYPSGNNGRAYVSGDFLTLQPGANDLALSSGSSTNESLATVEYYDHYLGI
jgi:phage-related protein